MRKLTYEKGRCDTKSMLASPQKIELNEVPTFHSKKFKFFFWFFSHALCKIFFIICVHIHICYILFMILHTLKTMHPLGLGVYCASMFHFVFSMFILVYKIFCQDIIMVAVVYDCQIKFTFLTNINW